MFPGFPREKREWTPALIDDGEIGKTKVFLIKCLKIIFKKAFRFIPNETGECSETFIGRVGFFSSNPFIRKKPDDKTTGLTKQVIFFISTKNFFAKNGIRHKKFMKIQKYVFFCIDLLTVTPVQSHPFNLFF
jgi:hypothetical protein